VTNTATTTYDLTATAINGDGCQRWCGHQHVPGWQLDHGAGSVAGTNVALNATGNIGTNAGSRLATAAGTLAAHGANVFIAETDAVTLDTVKLGDQHGDDDL